MDRIPPELREQILVGLPVKTLVLCTFVCKQWKSFIEDPSFIEAHLQVQRRDLMLVRTRPNEEAYSIYCDDEDFTLYEKFDFPVTRPYRGCYFRIIGNLDGVLCIASGNIKNNTYLWNPTIRKLVELPFPKVIYDTHGPFVKELGFGFDAKTNDYKVVRIVQLSSYPPCISPLQVELYSLSTGICRNISHSASNIKCQLNRSGRFCRAYINGAVHWFAKSSSLDNGMIISFHFGQEQFCCFEIPVDIFSDHSRVWPAVVQESLCLVKQKQGFMDIIWMMKEYGDSNSWTKWLNINLTNQVQRFIGSRKKGELLIQLGGRLCSFDYEKSGGKKPNINTIRDLGIESPEEHSDWPPSFYCERYIVSLALIGKSAVKKVFI